MMLSVHELHPALVTLTSSFYNVLQQWPRLPHHQLVQDLRRWLWLRLRVERQQEEGEVVVEEKEEEAIMEEAIIATTIQKRTIMAIVVGVSRMVMTEEGSSNGVERGGEVVVEGVGEEGVLMDRREA